MAPNPQTKDPDPYADPLPGGGKMAIIVPVIIGCAIVLAGLVLLESHVRKQRISELAQVEENVRADLREAYKRLRRLEPREALYFTIAAEEKIRRLKPTWRTHFAELRMARLMVEAEAEFMIDPKNSAADVEKRFSEALDLMTHASGEFWQHGVLGRARARFEMGRYREAEADLTLLMDRNPSFGTAYYWRSRARRELGDPEGAALDEERARRLGSWPPLRDFMADMSGEHRDILTRPGGVRD